MPGITGEFREIVEAYQSRVFSIAYRVLGDRGTAEEVAQDVFLELYRAFDDITSDEHLIAWLRRVAVHRATDALRRRPRILHGAAEFEDWMAKAPSEEGSVPLASEIERLLLELPRQAPAGFSARLMARLPETSPVRSFPKKRWVPAIRWATAVVLLGVAGGSYWQHQQQERVAGERARAPLFLALRMSAATLNDVQHKVLRSTPGDSE